MLLPAIIVGFIYIHPILATRNENKVHLKIVTIIERPFMFEREDLNNKTLKIGLVKDLLDILGRRLDFTYELYLVPDGQYGKLRKDGVWDGLIGEVSWETKQGSKCNIFSPMSESSIDRAWTIFRIPQ